MDLKVLNNIRVLIVEDDEEDFFILKKIFASIPDSQFNIDWISSFEEAKKVVQRPDHDVYLIDYRLGAETGLELLRIGQAKKRSEPFILLTGVGDPDAEWKSMRLAASDFLVKGTINRDILSRAIYYALERKKIEKQRVKELLDLSRSKDEFISIASHQLRTPATAVKQYVGMILEGFVGEVTDEQRIMLKKAYENNDRQLDIVHDLLRVAQVDAGHIELKKEPIVASKLIDEIIADVQSLIKERQQTVIFNTDDEDTAIMIDRKSFRMALENLIDNASKYSQNGKTIRISVLTKKDTVFISVEDEGVGIEKKQIKNLFEKFSRIPNELSTERGGTGLGLYWAKEIIDLHDGSLKVVSNPGKGTIFTISLPKTLNM